MPRNASDLTRRRVYTFFAIFIIIITILQILQEISMPIYAAYEFVPLAFAVITLIYINFSVGKTSFSNLSIQNNIMVLLFAIMLVFQVVAVVIARKSPVELGEGVSSTILIALAIVNRFV